MFIKSEIASFFPFQGTPPPLPIKWSVNDHSCYWYVQTTNIEMFSAFINVFSKLRVSADPVDQHGHLSGSHWCSISYGELSFRAHFSHHTKKTTRTWNMLHYYFWKSFLTTELFPVPAAPSIRTLWPINTASSILNIVDISPRFHL